MKTSRGEVAARYAKNHHVSLAEAARRFQVSRERVRQKWRDLFGDAETPTQEARARREEKIADLANWGLSATEIAFEVGIAKSTVRAIRERNDVVMINGHDKVAVTEETKTRILELARAGRSRAEIVNETGASYSTVGKYLRGRSTYGVRGPGKKCAAASEYMNATGCSLNEAAAKFILAPPSLFLYRKRRRLWTTLRDRQA